MGYVNDVYKDINPLKTDMYQYTMSQVYFDQGRQDEKASFYMHWRKPPFGGSYTVAAGLEGVVDFLKNFKFDDDKIAYLRSIKKKGQPVFTEDFLQYLKTSKLEIDVDAVPEGTVMTGAGPVVRISGPLVQCQLVESAILNIVNSSSMIATRAARIDEASGGKAIFADYSLRRGTSLDIAGPRASTIGGAKAVADMDAARLLGVTPTGTMAHSFIMGYRVNGVLTPESELKAFKDYLKSMHMNTVLLVDTYDPEQGIKNAIKAAIETGIELDGVRIDSGDLFQLTFKARELLDQAKIEHPELFGKTNIYLTNDLDETQIRNFYVKATEELGKPFPDNVVYGVGTALGNPGPLGGVYKLSACEPNTEIKESKDKSTVMVKTMKIAGRDPDHPELPGSKSSLPGIALDTVRLKDKNGNFIGDVIVDRAFDDKDGKPTILDQGYAISLADNHSEIPLPESASYETLLKPIFIKGEYVYPEHGEPAKKMSHEGSEHEITDLDKIQAYCKEQRSHLPQSVRDVIRPDRYTILLDPRTNEDRMKIMSEMMEMPPPPVTKNIDMYIDNENGFRDPNLSLADGGSLYVPDGEKVSKKMGDLITNTTDGIIVLSQDFHPADHISFMTNHPGVMEYRKKILEVEDKDTKDVMNPAVLAFSEIVLDRQGMIIGVKDGDHVRKVELISKDLKTTSENGWVPSTKDKGRVAKVLDDWLEEPFSKMRNISTQMLWTPHCIQGTRSSEFSEEMNLPESLKEMLKSDLISPDLKYHDEITGNTFYVVRKGMNSEIDSYGIGIENDKKTFTTAQQVFQEIAMDLRDQDVEVANINIGGLATNFCVEFSHNNVVNLLCPALQMRGIEPNINLLTDISRGIPIPGGIDDPFSLEGAPKRMNRMNGGKTNITYSTAEILKRHPEPVVYGGLADGGATRNIIL